MAADDGTKKFKWYDYIGATLGYIFLGAIDLVIDAVVAVGSPFYHLGKAI